MTCSNMKASRVVTFKSLDVIIILIFKLNLSRILEYVILTKYSEACFFFVGLIDTKVILLNLLG